MAQLLQVPEQYLMKHATKSLCMQFLCMHTSVVRLGEAHGAVHHISFA